MPTSYGADSAITKAQYEIRDQGAPANLQAVARSPDLCTRPRSDGLVGRQKRRRDRTSALWGERRRAYVGSSSLFLRTGERSVAAAHLPRRLALQHHGHILTASLITFLA